MIVSMATVVLPVCRSPMISWRWPRPIAVIASIALMPVCSGSFTGCRCTTVGACSSSGRRPSSAISPRPSIGWPSGSTTRPRKRVADRHREDLAGALDRPGPPRCPAASPRMTTPISRTSRFSATPSVPSSNSQQLVGHRRGQALDVGDAVAGLGDDADLLARDLRRVGRDVALQRAADLVRGDRQLGHCLHPCIRSASMVPVSPAGPRRASRRPYPVIRCRIAASRDTTLPSMTSSFTRTTRPPSSAGSTVTCSETCRP